MIILSMHSCVDQMQGLAEFRRILQQLAQKPHEMHILQAIGNADKMINRKMSESEIRTRQVAQHVSPQNVSPDVVHDLTLYRSRN
mgnify:CR=1 FL=1